MANIQLTIEAAVNDAISGLNDVTKAIDEQKVSSVQLAREQMRLQDSLDALVEAQFKLSENTDPEKQRDLEKSVLDAAIAAQKQKDKVDELAESHQDLGEETKTESMSMADLKAAFDMTTQVIGYAKQALDATVGKAAQWGDTIGDLSQLTGTSAEETSRMAATFELAGVEISTLESAMKAMTKNGLQLNIETLKKLAVEYQSLQDPVAQNEFLMKKFGRAGIEMAEIMGRSAEELDKLSAAASVSGKVIGDDAAAAAENFNVQLEILKQRGEGAAITIGNAVIPTLTQAIDGFDNYTRVAALLNLKMQEGIGLIDQHQLELRAEAVAAGDLSAVYTAQLTPSVDDHSRATLDDTYTVMGLSSAMETHAGKMADDTAAVVNNQNAQAGLNEVWGYAFTAISQLNLKEEEKRQLEDALALASGKVTVEELARRDAVITLTARYENGLITQKQYIEQLTALQNNSISAREAVYGVRDAINSLQDRTVHVNYQVVGAEPPGGVGGSGNAYSGGGGNGGNNGMRASGGPVMAGQAYMVGERGPEMFVPGTSGTVIPNSQIAYGGITINVSGAGNPQAVAVAVRAELDRVARSAENRRRF